MVLRGQPVGEQGAADRWTALDPYIAGSGAGAARGAGPLRGAPPFSPFELEGPVGPFFYAGILPCLQIVTDGPRVLPAPWLSCFAPDPPGPPAGGPFGTRPLSSAIGPLSRPLGPRAFSLVQGGGT